MLSSVFLVMTLSGPLHEGTQIRNSYTIDLRTGQVIWSPGDHIRPRPPRASAAAKPVVVDTPKPSPYTVDRILDPVRLPKGYPKDLQWQFPRNYRRDDQ